MKRILGLFLLVLCMSLNVNARIFHKANTDTLSHYYSGSFWSNWSVGAQMEGNMYFGEDDRYGKLYGRLSPSGGLSIVKRATPIIYYRALFDFGTIHCWYKHDSPTRKYEGTMFHETFRDINTQLNVMFDVSTAYYGYRPDRSWRFVPYAGVGWIHPISNGHHNREIFFTLGAVTYYRIGDRLNLMLDFRHMFVNPRMNFVVTPNRFYEGMQTIGLGITYNIGKHGFKKIQAGNGNDYTNMLHRLDSLNELVNRKPAIDSSSLHPVVQNIIQHDTIEKHDTIYRSMPLMVRFPINQWVITSTEAARLDFYLKNEAHLHTARSIKLYRLVGSADKATGSADRNQFLSEQRVQAVFKLLSTKYHIKESMMTTEADGDRNNLFDDAAANRAVFVWLER